jgi:hypothetical protein
MKKRILSLMVAMLTAGISLAGNVKVLATEFSTMDICAEGAYFTINVKMQASNVRKEECGIIVLMTNHPWDGDKMTIEELGDLCEMMCEGEATLAPVGASKTLNVPIDVLLEPQFLKGNEKTFYLKAFVVDMNKNVILSEGQMINFQPDTKAVMAQKKKQDKALGFSILKEMNDRQMSGDSHIGDVEKTCSYCSGSGRSGQGTCTYCGGSGKVRTKGKVSGKGTIFDLVP